MNKQKAQTILGFFRWFIDLSLVLIIGFWVESQALFPGQYRKNRDQCFPTKETSESPGILRPKGAIGFPTQRKMPHSFLKWLNGPVKLFWFQPPVWLTCFRMRKRRYWGASRVGLANFISKEVFQGIGPEAKVCHLVLSFPYPRLKKGGQCPSCLGKAGF